MSVNDHSLEISGILPSSDQVQQEDQYIQEIDYDSDDYVNEDSNLEASSGNENHQLPSILAQRNEVNLVEPTVIPTDYDSFILSTVVVGAIANLRMKSLVLTPWKCSGWPDILLDFLTFPNQTLKSGHAKFVTGLGTPTVGTALEGKKNGT